MASRQGIEPRPRVLETLVLPEHLREIMVPRTRIELVIKAYQASVIPFNYPGIYLVPLDRIELPIDDYKSTVMPFN